MSVYFRLNHGKPAARHNIDSITPLIRLVGCKAKTSNPTVTTLDSEMVINFEQELDDRGVDSNIKNMLENIYWSLIWHVVQLSSFCFSGLHP